MIEEILEPENLAAAWKRVKANKGAPGIDGMTVGDFPAFARGHWPRIAIAIREGSYRPAPVKRVWIPKPDGSKRPLGIPTMLDRVIQQAVAQVLGPLFEADFSEHSYPRLAHLLQAQLHLLGGAGTLGVGQTAGEVVLLEAMEAAAHASQTSACVGNQPQQ